MSKILRQLFTATSQNKSFNLVFLIGTFLFFQTSFSQIAADGLNNSTSLFTITGGAYYTGNSAGIDGPASSPFALEGTHAYGVTNGTATLTSSNINTTSYTGIALALRVASFSLGGTGNGAETADMVTVEISPNGGTNWYPTARVTGNNNAYWTYATGTGNANTAYDGDATVVSFAPGSTQGNKTTDGYSRISITNLPAVTSLRVRITLLNNATAERWLIDDFKITGTPTSLSEINLKGNGNNISSADLSPSAADHTDFGSVSAASGTIVRTFTIENLGSGPLTVGAISFSGTAAADFSASVAPSPIAAGADNTFTVTFDPSAVGVRNATISIVNNDANENPYTFAITGTGTADTNVADYAALLSPEFATINEGGAPVEVISQVYEGGFTENPGQGENITAWIGYSASNTNPNGGGWTWIAASYLGDDPSFSYDEYYAELGAGITAGTYYYAARFQIGAGPYAYGGLGGAWNNNSGVLTVNGDTVDLANIQSPATATIVQGGAVTVQAQVFEAGVTPAAGASANISGQIGYSSSNTNPSTAGWTWVTATFNTQAGQNDQYQATIGSTFIPGTYYYASRFQKTGSAQYVYGGTAGIWNNDSGVLTVVPQQEINVQGNATTIVDGDTTPIAADHTDFGTVALGSNLERTFTIQNTGGANLVLDSPAVVMIDTDAFTVTQQPATTVAPGASTTFKIRFTPTSTTSESNTVLIGNNDADESVYSFEVRGAASIAEPTATAATNVLQTSFNANWTAAPGATSYRLDVATDANFETILTATDLIISEYVEGSSNNKYIEIFNGTGAAVNLSNYELRSYANASTSPTSNILSGTLANNATVVYKNSSATIYTGASTAMSAVAYNGNDAIAIYKISSASLVDIFGNIGENPPTAWTSGAFTTVDKTLVRNANVLGGVTSDPATGFPTLSTEWTQSNIDVVSNLGSHTFNAVNSFYVPTYKDRNVGNVLTFNVNTNLTANTTYYYRVRAFNGSASMSSNTISVVTQPTSVTWNGAAWSNVTGPDATIEAVIAGAFNSATNNAFTAKKLTINSGSFTIAAGTTITVVNEVINNLTDAEFVIESNGNLIQNNDLDNIGSATVLRNTNPLKRLDYVLWSAPVDDQNLLAFSPATIATRFYVYNSGTDEYNNIVSSTNTFGEGNGYLIRMPDNHPTTATVWNGIFKGEPRNGNVSIPVTNVTYNAVGNPYPSTIDADLFIGANGISEALYFWRKTNAAPTTAYATYTLAGGTGTEAGMGDPLSLIPNGVIQVGQGFIAKATTSNLVFNNQMRVANNDNQFFRNSLVDRNRIWLNLTNTSGVFSQTMLSYMTGATQGVDAAIDGLYFNDSQVALTSLIGTAEYAIQGRALPFDTADVVPMGFKAINAGTYTISLDHADGLFEDASQNIFLKDNVLGVTHDLRSGAYTFAADAGVSNSRFEIVYQSTLGVSHPIWDANQVVVYTQSNDIIINSGSVKMAKVAIYDLAGRLIASQDAVHASQTKLFAGKSTTILVVKITAEDGAVVTKKVTR